MEYENTPEGDEQVVEAIQRRSSYRAPDAAPAATHDDDALALALEQEVSRYTAQAPAAIPAAVPLDADDDELVRLITADIASGGDTLGAIEQLTQLLATRAATASIPVHAPVAESPVAEPPVAEPPVAEPVEAPAPAPLLTPPVAEPVEAPTPAPLLTPPVFAPSERPAPAEQDSAVPFDALIAVTEEPLDEPASRAARTSWTWFAATLVVLGVAAACAYLVLHLGH